MEHIIADCSRESEALARQLEDKWRIAAALNLRCLLAITGQNPLDFIPLWYEANRLYEEAGDTGSAIMGIISLSSTMVVAGDFKAARNLFKEGLPLILRDKNKIALMVSLTHIAGLAGLEASEREAESARLGAQLMSASEEFAKYWLLGNEPPFSKRIREPMLQAIRSHLDQATYEAMFAEGKRMSSDEVITLAQQIIDSEPPLKADPAKASPPGSTPPAGLSEREVEVLHLVARGLSNPAIAEKLVVSRRTVEAHLRSIFAKIEVTSRTAATRFALEHNLT